MLTKRIIPCLDVDRGRVVKGVSFVELRDAGDPAEMAAFYDQEGADELVLLDITASSEDRDIMINVVKDVSEKVFIPLTVGGGMRKIDDVRKMLEAGSDKVSLNTAAILNPSLINESSRFFGSQCIVVALDAKAVSEDHGHSLPKPASRNDLPVLDDKSKWEIFINGGRTPTGLDAVKWATRAAELGAGELLVTSMDADGHRIGYDLGLTQAIAKSVSIPIIASGGAGNLTHLYDALETGLADAVLADSIFHYGTYSIKEAKDYLSKHGQPMRPNVQNIPD